MSHAIESIQQPYLELEQIQNLENEAISDKGDITHILNSMMDLTKLFLGEEKSYWDNLEQQDLNWGKRD